MKILFAGLLMALALTGFWRFILSDIFGVEQITEVAKPWIEVERVPAFELSENGKKIRELKSGDELALGIIVETGITGRATIHFKEGSRVRLDGETRLALRTADFEQNDNTLRVKLYLFAGRVWSRVVSLATPASFWHVETGNAVAVVRGTTFGVEYNQGTSSFIGSKQNIAVSVLNPVTREPLKGSAFVVSSNEFIAVRDEDVRRIIAYEKAVSGGAPASVAQPELSVQKITSELQKSSWVQEEMGTDLLFDEEESNRDAEVDLRTAHRSEETPPSILDTLKSFIPFFSKEESAPFPFPQEKSEMLTSPLSTSQETSSESAIQVTPRVIDSTAGTAGTATKQIPQPQKLSIIPAQSLERIFEGTKLTFKAALTMSDGSTRNVTSDVEWMVIGPIGVMDVPGIFLPRLDATVAELGQAPGSVTATFKDPATGSSFFANTPIFTIEAHIEETLIPLDS